MQKEIIFTLDDNNDLVITVKGVKGKACKDLTRDIEAALGSVISSEPTKEAYEREVKNVQRVHAKS